MREGLLVLPASLTGHDDAESTEQGSQAGPNGASSRWLF